MKNGGDHVVELAPQRRARELQSVEFRLGEENYGLELTVRDTAGNCIILEYALQSKPSDFDMEALLAAWSRWKDKSRFAR